MAPPASKTTVTPASLFHPYPLAPGSYDEALSALDAARPHWAPVIRALEGLGQHELTRRQEQAQQLLYEHGVTYNVLGDPQDLQRPWQLDPIPLLMAEEEWQYLATALVQRARLLNAIVADVYGPQTLLHQDLLPPELLFAHHGFLRPCHGLPVPKGCYLHLYAADIARGPDGHWQVLADLTQMPAGAGYALENRLILSRTLSDVLRAVQVQRVAMFFETFRNTLRDLAPRQHDNPRIVLLTPGPHYTTYFEHVYLARYLGYTLVEGGDLTVRDNRVYLKTLAGLQPIDVILRRQADYACDPLSLSSDATAGVAGLMHAVRAGNVAIANALGSGWVETAGLIPFLPALCQHLLGETLQLSSIATWWCGQPESLTYVQEQLSNLILTSATQNNARQIIYGAQLSRTARRRCLARLRAHPYAFVAQAPLTSSTVPVWRQSGVQPRHVVVRVYVVATPNGYMAMPGGLTRVSTLPGLHPGSIQYGDGSKDTWILSRTSPNPFSLLPPPGQPVALRRSGYDLPSRVADNLLWLGRYSERAEGAIRLLRSVLRRFTDDIGVANPASLPVLLRAVSDRWSLPIRVLLEGSELTLAALESPLWTVMFEAKFTDSVRATLNALYQVATTVRDRIALDAWRILTHLNQDFTQGQPENLASLSAVFSLLGQTLITLAAFSGLGVENMTRGPGWHFLDMGRRLERSLYTISLLQSLLVDVEEQEGAVLDAVLEIADSSMTYRSRYLTTLQFAPVLDLLLTDDTNPRSLLFQLNALQAHVENLPRAEATPSLSTAQRLALTAVTSVRLATIETLCSVDSQGQRTQLATLLQQLADTIPALAETITHQYLSHAEPSRHLAGRVNSR